MPGPILLFDVMDTLVHDPFYVEVLDFFGMSKEEIFAIKDKEAWLAFERGEINEARAIEHYFTDRRSFDHDGLRATLRDGYRWLDGIPALLSELSTLGFHMHALSNYPCWWKMLESKLGISRHVAWSFVSCETGVRKPDPRAYTGAAQQLGVSTSDCLFIDDRAKNCNAARDTGMDAIAFVTVPALRDALRARGILG